MSIDLSPASALTAIVAGGVSFLSPCVLPLVPGYVSYIAGDATVVGDRTSSGGSLRALVSSVSFVLGFSTVFTALGASATALGRLLLSYRYEANIAAGVLVIAFGLLLTGLVRIPWLQREFRIYPTAVPAGRPVAAYALGLAFAFGWTPCIGPVLGAILTASAAAATVGTGVALLGFYSLGLGLPFIAAAFFTDALVLRLKGLKRAGHRLQVGAGAIMILMGFAILTGRLTELSYWLLEHFPALGRIG
jgi:cytochrome c-type biogenesis protein